MNQRKERRIMAGGASERAYCGLMDNRKKRVCQRDQKDTIVTAGGKIKNGNVVTERDRAKGMNTSF